MPIFPTPEDDFYIDALISVCETLTKDEMSDIKIDPPYTLLGWYREHLTHEIEGNPEKKVQALAEMNRIFAVPEGENNE